MDNHKHKHNNNVARCALISNNIYCYGGIPIKGYQSLNVQHIRLDLTQLQAMPTLNDSYIKWRMVTDVINSTHAPVPPRGYQASAVAISDDSYVMYGGAISAPFLNYNPQLYAWRTLQVDPNVNITFRNTIVNMGDDMFWLWGGENFPNFSNYLQNVANIYDYKAEKWVNQIVENNAPMRVEHTATLGLDGGIYILGGATRYPDGNFSYSDFNDVIRFDTKTLKWSYFTAGGHPATSRVSHTATQLPNRNQLIVYGGINSDPAYLDSHDNKDYCIIFDYSSRSFQNINLANPPNSINNLYGHFAEIYNETYLVIAFGFSDEEDPGSSLRVLNVSDLHQPSWVISFSDPSNANATDTGNGFRDEYIAIIVISLLLIAIAIFIYFYKSRGNKYKFPKDPFVIDDSDPRLNSKDTEFNDADITKYAKLTIDNEEESYNKPNDDYPADSFCKPLGNTIDMDDQNSKYIKPTEN
ncbi:unnamed protein product [Cunninghamella echinulata]